MPPHFGLWLKIFNVMPKVVSGQQAECGGAVVGKMPNVTWPEGSFAETVKGWQSGWFYIIEPRDADWAAAPRIPIRNPDAAHLLGKEGPVLGRIYRADQTHNLPQGHEGQENQACQRDPGHAHSSGPSVPTPDLLSVGVRSGQAPDATWLFGMTHEDIWKVIFKAGETPPPTTEDRGLSLKRQANSVCSSMFSRYTLY